MDWLKVSVAEAIAVAIAAALWWFGFLPWWSIPLALVVPPVVIAVVAALVLLSAVNSGENLFQ
jgi:membrane protein YdbS with pleckstrin-like domain